MNEQQEERIIELLDQGYTPEQILVEFNDDNSDTKKILETIQIIQGTAPPMPSKESFLKALKAIDLPVTTMQDIRYTKGSQKTQSIFQSFLSTLSMHKGVLAGSIGAVAIAVGVGSYMFLSPSPVPSESIEVAFEEDAFDLELSMLDELGLDDDLEIDETLLALIDLDISAETISQPDLDPTEIQTDDEELEALSAELEAEFDSLLDELGEFSEFDASIEDIDVDSLS